MPRSAEQDLPDICIQEAVDCHACTATTARELARACPGLPAKLVTQLFVQIHVHAACTRMHANFAQAYTEAMDAGKTLEIKKPMGVRRSFAATAAA
jgi:hypothetical protein